MPDDRTANQDDAGGPQLGAAGSRSSRESSIAAGWECGESGTFRQLLPPDAKAFSWLSPVPLIKSRNDLLVRWLGDPTGEQRRRWVARKRAGGADPDLTVRTHAERERVSFLLMGDPGEGDASQYCVVPSLLSQAPGTSFLMIASDVIYPAGDVTGYEQKFYRPYDEYPAPIYAVPGNHDWYEGLNGFMWQFCGMDYRLDHGSAPGAPDAPDAPYAPIAGTRLKRLAVRLLWRGATRVDPRLLRRMSTWRARPGQQAVQPGPYFALDAGPVLVVGIDTGISGTIDGEQGAWLERISRTNPKPKILVTGTPLYSDAARQPVTIEGSSTTVDDIVRAPEHGYVAAIGGDQHNYQRYPVRVGGERTIQYIVSGGGGAFLHDTHLIPRVDLPDVTEDDFRCYPLRGDSLSMFSRTYRNRLGWLVGNVYIPPEQASALMAEKLGVRPVRPSDRDVVVTEATRRAYRKMTRLPQRFPGLLQEYVHRFFDRNEPPLFKSFLRVDAGPDEIVIRCFAATGCRAHEDDPPVEDEIRCVRDGAGTWRWQPNSPV